MKALYAPAQLLYPFHSGRQPFLKTPIRGWNEMQRVGSDARAICDEIDTCSLTNCDGSIVNEEYGGALLTGSSVQMEAFLHSAGKESYQHRCTLALTQYCLLLLSFIFSLLLPIPSLSPIYDGVLSLHRFIVSGIFIRRGRALDFEMVAETTNDNFIYSVRSPTSFLYDGVDDGGEGICNTRSVLWFSCPCSPAP